MTLDILSFGRAIKQLDQALAYGNSDLAQSDPELALHLRAAAIQAFEFTYELSVKMLRRTIEKIEASEFTVRDMTFDELIRRAWSIGLLNEEITQWREFRKQRGTTSHTYDEDKAELIYREIPRFLAEAQYLYAALEKRQAA